MSRLVLASSSLYRRQLLERFGLAFAVRSPDVDETPQAQEGIATYTQRLSIAKAQAVAKHYPAHLIIGSDLCGVCKDRFIGKPGNYDNAVQQLRYCSGQQVDFHTGVCLLDSRTGRYQYADEISQVHFRKLDDETIHSYVRQDQPYHCAGSIRGEQLGIVLLDKITSNDPTALIGLPLIVLARMLRHAGVSLP